MLKSYQLQNGGLKGTVLSDGDPIPTNALWVDLFDPTDSERLRVNALLGVEMPTRADMEEIEVSSRLYQESGATFLTALILSNAETETPVADVVSFILTQEPLVHSSGTVLTISSPLVIWSSFFTGTAMRR